MIPVHRARLPQGMRVVILPTPQLHVVEVGVYTFAGPRFEAPSTNGLSHLLEHILFRGSQAFPDALSMHQAIEACGGPLSGSTARDNSLYSLCVAPRHTERAIELLGQFLLQPTFAELDLEKELILEERLQERDATGQEIDLDNLSRRSLWPGHSLGMPILGPETNIRRFSRKDVEGWYRRTLVGPGCLAYAAGPVDESSVLDAFKRVFSPLPSGEAPPVIGVDGEKVDGYRSVFVRHEGSQDDLLLSFRTPSLHDSRGAALQLLSGILGDGVSSRLQWRICERLGLAYTIESGLDLYWDTGALDIEASVGPGKVGKVLQEVLQALRELAEKGPDEGELARARERYRLGMEFSLDSPSKLAAWYAGADLFQTAPSLEQRLADVEGVTATQIRELARELFQPHNLALTVVGDLKAAQNARLDTLARGL